MKGKGEMVTYLFLNRKKISIGATFSEKSDSESSSPEQRTPELPIGELIGHALEHSSSSLTNSTEGSLHEEEPQMPQTNIDKLTVPTMKKRGTTPKVSSRKRPEQEDQKGNNNSKKVSFTQ